MRFKKWISATAASIILAASFSTASISAEETRTIADESIYDVLVDRYFNGSGNNDIDVNTKDVTQFAGGDFEGLVKKRSLIKDMGFTIVSIGSVFETETYDGQAVTSYEKIEEHFGTSEEFLNVIDTYKKDDMSIMVDFPLSKVSENHEWAQDAAKKSWIKATENGLVEWDLSNTDVQMALKEALVNFVTSYNIGGVRLTNITGADTAYINSLIDTLKAKNPALYIISNEESDANFDAKFYNETNEIYRNIYKNVDLDSSNLLKYVDPYLAGKEVPAQIMFDSLKTNRFTFDSAEQNMFPPTRLKAAYASTLFLPGVPVVQYGSEIAMNGEAGPEAHQFYNFKTDEELIHYIENLQKLRNESSTLRHGDFKMLKNENGFIAFTRKSAEEEWLVVINNTSKTNHVNISQEEIGEDKELRGMLDSDIIRANKDGNYAVILDREVVEVFQIIDKRGLNVSYLVALGLVYVLFIAFVIIIIKRGRERRAIQDGEK
ncbi:alpha-amylase family glycosyl hydrolase [Solibacillus sp. CAU 1738]|uniref:alpha-amylase family glycosyl hydrolase n=1 Tax=Solibacillus sp. CAU 1738 TaxID=3140363 RepID=UPI00326115B4